MERAEQPRSAPQPALYIFKKAGATFHLDSFLPLILIPATFSCFSSSPRELGHLLSRRFFLYRSRLLVFTPDITRVVEKRRSIEIPHLYLIENRSESMI
jgi:hypothetical protein